jgi:nicotinate phosphoribosyltransferase
MLDDAGFTDAKILASNDLDEHLIADLKQQGATIAVWGVGTKLVTAFDQPALGGVYKLTALRDEGGAWQHKLKLSEQSVKVSIPGILQVRRFSRDNQFVADAIYDTLTGIGDSCTIVDAGDMTRRRAIEPQAQFDDLLVPIFRDGRPVYTSPTLEETRQRTLEQLACVHPTIKRFTNPHSYPAGLEEKLFDLRQQLIFKARGVAPPAPALAAAEVREAQEAPVEAEPAAAPNQPAPQTTPPSTPPAPQRPKFAGIGAKFGQVPTGSSVRVRVNPNVRGGTLKPRPSDK